MNETINKVLQNAAAAVSPANDYYVDEDGLKHCPKCKGALQCKVSFGGVEKIVNCCCPCFFEAKAAEEAAKKKAEKLRRIKQYRNAGFSEAELQNYTFANDDMSNPKITAAMKRYVNAFPDLKEKGKGLVLYGSIGTGKTYAAAEVVNALIDSGTPCLMTNFARLTNTLQGKFEGRQDYLDSLNNYDLLVIDDLAAERNTEYMNELVFNIIDSRYRVGLPMIITTNLTLKELTSPADLTKQRIYNRILERCFPVEVKGVNRRGEKFKNDYNDMKSLLGL